MLREEIKALETGSRELRKFGLLVGGIFTFLGAWFAWRGKSHYPYFLVPGVVLIVSGALFPRSLRRIYIGWMSLALVLGMVVSTVLLCLFFYFVVTSIGLVARVCGKDFLNRKLNRNASSYWVMRDRSIKKQRIDYEQQY